MCRPGRQPWSQIGSEAFVIAASASCEACRAAKSFDEEVFSYATAHRMPVYYVFSGSSANRNRERELVLAGRHVISVPSLQRFGLARVPSVARVDSRGVIRSRWTGAIPESGHAAIFGSVTSGRGMESYSRIESSSLNGFVSEKKAQVVAFSEPGLNRSPAVHPKDHSCGRHLCPGSARAGSRFVDSCRLPLDYQRVVLPGCGT